MPATPSQLLPATLPSRTAEQIEKAAAHVVAPAQHEVNQKGDETGHQQHVVERSHVAVYIGEKRRRFRMNAYFGDSGRYNRIGRLRSFWRLPAVVHCRRIPGSRLRRRLLESFRNDHLIGSLLKLIHSSRYVIHDFIHALAVIRQILGESGKLRVQSEPDQVQNQKSDAANDEAGDRARQSQLHEGRHYGIQQECNDAGDDHGDKKNAAEV